MVGNHEKLKLYHTQYCHKKVTITWASKPFVSKDYFSITLINKDVLKTRLLSGFEQKKPFLSLLILTTVKCMTWSWEEDDPIPSRYIQKEKKADKDEKDLCAFCLSSSFP